MDTITGKTQVKTFDECWDYLDEHCSRVDLKVRDAEISIKVWLRPGVSTWRRTIEKKSRRQLLHILRWVVFEIITDGAIVE